MPNKNAGVTDAEPTTEVAKVKQPETPKNEIALGTTSIGAFVPRLDQIEIPNLNVLQKLSDFPGDTGAIVIDRGTYQLLEADQEHTVIALDARQRWKEDTPFDSKIQGRIFDTQEEALAAESDFNIIEFAEIIFMIPEIEGVPEEAFPLTIGDTNYALGKIYVHKDAYRYTFKRLNTFSVFNKKHFNNVKWVLKSELFSKGQYSWFIPHLQVTKEEVEPEVFEFLEAIC